jgi:hypothetical protein
METKALSVYIQRGAVVVNGDDLIDDTDLTNAKFYTKWNRKAAVQELISSPPVEGDEKKVTKKQAKATVLPELQQAQLFEMQKEKLEIQKLEEGNRLMKIKADKAAGMVIPTDLVKTLIRQHSKSTTDAYRMAQEDMFILIAAKYGIPPQELAELRRRGLDSINKAVEDAIELTKKELKNIVNEYSAVRGVGEKI